MVGAPTSAHARSDFDYDTLIAPTDEISVGYTWSGGCSIDVTDSWSSHIHNILTGADRTSFENRKAWLVSQVKSTEDGSDWTEAVFVTWWEEEELPAALEFQPPNGAYSSNNGYLYAIGGHSAHLFAATGCSVIAGGKFPDSPKRIVGYNSNETIWTILTAVGVDISYPVGYEGEPLPSSSEYVAMGDSYSSGEGAFNYISDETNCHRSTESYPYLLSVSMGDKLTFAACSGAITDDLYAVNHQNSSEIGQLLYLNADTETVTLTIGGNDLGFSDIAHACANNPKNTGYGCQSNMTLQLLVEERLDALAGEAQNAVYAPGTSREIHPLTTILEDIAAKAPNADIYIAGYPHLFGSDVAYFTPDGNAPGGYKCIVTQGSGFSVAYGFWDTEWLNSIADSLNTLIEDAVDSVQPLNISYVPIDDFEGHGLCDSGASYLNGVVFDSIDDPAKESLHPNFEGMGFGYASSFMYVMQ